MLNVPVGPRRINELRRVSLPVRQAGALGITPGSWVVIRADPRDTGVLLIKAAHGDTPDYAIRDPRRPRRVSDTGQVALPAPLLHRAEMATGSWVAFTRTRAALRVFSAHRVREDGQRR